MAEIQDVQDMWEDEVGHVIRVNLPVPDVVHGKYAKRHEKYCGLYFRYYDKVDREHKFCLYIVPDSEIKQTRTRPTSHLAVLAMAIDFLKGVKISYCIGYYIENDVLKRNSCSNIRTEHDRALNDRTYKQLYDHVKEHFYNKIKPDGLNTSPPIKPTPVPKPIAAAPAPVPAKKVPAKAPAAAAAAKATAPPTTTNKTKQPVWPALTLAGTECQKCEKKGKDIFCAQHTPDVCVAETKAPAPVSAPIAHVEHVEAKCATPPRPPKATRPWPAQTSKKQDCKLCLKEKKGVFCRYHDDA